MEANRTADAVGLAGWSPSPCLRLRERVAAGSFGTWTGSALRQPRAEICFSSLNRRSVSIKRRSRHRLTGAEMAMPYRALTKASCRSITGGGRPALRFLAGGIVGQREQYATLVAGPSSQSRNRESAMGARFGVGRVKTRSDSSKYHHIFVNFTQMNSGAGDESRGNRPYAYATNRSGGTSG
jgi:hypothetical protein